MPSAPIRELRDLTRARDVRAMGHSDKQIEEAAQRFEQLADALDPDTTKVEDLSDLNAVATALGVSRQAARQRFADKVHT